MTEHTHRRQFELPFSWPEPPFSIVLVEPEIPQNTGNIARLCAATGSPLHLVGPLGFQTHDRALRRAGVDYWDAVDITREVNFQQYLANRRPPRFFLFSTAGERSIYDVAYQPGDAFVFGSEGKGLSDSLLDAYPDCVLQIPMKTDRVRSLNLANTESIVLYEALRQVNCRNDK